MYHHGSGGRNINFAGHKDQGTTPDSIAYSDGHDGMPEIIDWHISSASLVIHLKLNMVCNNRHNAWE
jgi:hypothetical protein